MILIAVCLQMAACMPSTITELKETGAQTTFAMPDQYQKAHRDMSHMLRECIDGGFLAATNRVDTNLYPDLQLGEIMVSNNNMGDKSVMLFIEVKKDGDATNVHVSSANTGRWSDYPERVEQWATGETKACP